MNTVGGLIYHDIICRMYQKPISLARGTFIVKTIVFLNGLFYLVAAPFFQKSKYIAQLTVMVGGVTYGVKVGVLVLGTTFPKCNVKGVICGILAGLAIVSWISIGSMQYDLYSKYHLSMSTDKCTVLMNSTIYMSNLTTSGKPVAAEPFILYRLSYMYYPVLGLFTTLLVAMAVSYLTGFNDVNKMNPLLMIPSVRPAIIQNGLTN